MGVEKTLMVVAALAALVAIVATAVAWRSGRRARRAADLVAQLLEPPVVEPRVRSEGTRALPAPDDVSVAAATSTVDVADPTPPGPAIDPEPRRASSGDEHAPAEEEPPATGSERPAADSRRAFGTATGVGAAFDRADPAPARIPVLDLDRLRSWLTLGDVNLGRLAVVSVELDNLGVVQERLGYAAGAQLLEAITQRLRTVTRPRDVVAHVNQERFVLVCRDVPDPAAAEGLAERISMGVAHPSVVLAGVAEVTASIGVALATDLEERPESVLRRAIKAGNQARALGGARGSRSVPPRRRPPSRKVSLPPGSPATSCASTTFRSSAAPPGASPASRPSCGGSIRSTGCCCPRSSCPTPSAPA